MTKNSQVDEWGANYVGTVCKYTTTNCRVVSIENATDKTVRLICIGKQQWGSYTNTGNAYAKTTTFPIAFTTVYAVMNSHGKNDDGALYYNSLVYTVTTKSFTHNVYKGFYTGWVAFGKQCNGVETTLLKRHSPWLLVQYM